MDDTYELPDEFAIVSLANDIVVSVSYADAREIERAMDHQPMPTSITINDLAGQEHSLNPKYIATIVFTTRETRIREAQITKAVKDEVKYIDPDDD